MDNLYFIPIIVQALQQPSPREALIRAFEAIREMGSQPRYKTGYTQFLVFMSIAWEGAVGRPVDLNAGEEQRPFIIEVRVGNEGRLVGKSPLMIGHEASFTGLTPGQYCVSLDTGWTLWEGALEAKDLLWAHAFPGQNLRLAASTERPQRVVSRTLQLLDGAITVEVLPGPESGTLRFSLTKLEDYQ